MRRSINEYSRASVAATAILAVLAAPFTDSASTGVFFAGYAAMGALYLFLSRAPRR